METHKPILCPDCGKEMEEPLLPAHLENECPKRAVRCEYCELKFPDDEFVSHESFCGSRTEECDTCGKYVMLRDLAAHPSICGNEEILPPPREPAAFQGDFGTDDLVFCPYCLQPFAMQEAMVNHIAGQFEVLMGKIFSEDFDDLQSVLVHVGTINDPSELEMLLSVVLQSGNATALRLLLEQGAIKSDLCLTIQGRELPLIHQTVQYDNAAAIEALGDHQANLNALDGKGNTALHRAIRKGRMDCVRALLKAGARSDIPGHHQHLPMQCALDSKSEHQTSMVQLLISSGITLEGIKLATTHWKLVRDSVTALLQALYMGKAEEPSQLRQRLASFFSAPSCHLGTCKLIQTSFLSKIHSRRGEYLSVKCNDGEFQCHIRDGQIVLDFLNDGDLPFSWQVFLPSGDIQTRIDSSIRVLPSHEETTCTIHFDEPTPALIERLTGQCLTVQLLCKSPQFFRLFPILTFFRRSSA